MISLLVTILILALVVSLIFWILTLFPIPQPFLNIIKVIIAVIVLLYVVSMLPGLGYHAYSWR